MRKVVDVSRTGQKQREKRQHRIRDVISSLPTAECLIQLGGAEKLPLMQLWEASLQFINGFYSTSILNSAFAAEYGLLLRLNDKLEQAAKNKIASRMGGLSLRGAINKSRSMLINEEFAKDLDVLNNLRDMSAHPSNWIILLKEVEEMAINDQESMKKWVSEVTHKSPDEIAGELKADMNLDKAEKALDRLISYKDKHLGKMPDLQWAAHKKTLAFQTEAVKNYSKRMIQNLIQEKEIVNLMNKSNDPAKYIQKKYPYPQELAEKAIRIAYNTLRQLDFLS